MNKYRIKIEEAVHFLENNIESLIFVSFDSEIMEMDQELCVQIVNFLFKEKSLKILLGLDKEDVFVSLPQRSSKISEFKLDQIDDIRNYALHCINEN
jgi:hypothetical protein